MQTGPVPRHLQAGSSLFESSPKHNRISGESKKIPNKVKMKSTLLIQAPQNSPEMFARHSCPAPGGWLRSGTFGEPEDNQERPAKMAQRENDLGEFQEGLVGKSPENARRFGAGGGSKGRRNSEWNLQVASSWEALHKRVVKKEEGEVVNETNNMTRISISGV